MILNMCYPPLSNPGGRPYIFLLPKRDGPICAYMPHTLYYTDGSNKQGTIWTLDSIQPVVCTFVYTNEYRWIQERGIYAGSKIAQGRQFNRVYEKVVGVKPPGGIDAPRTRRRCD